ncbi:hypothetical protein BTR23_20460 [Alkalihalophilus pseudofirmus]|nr:hypothetical protein BTR23_20460 [Alkalihalophilus pseudofirmus]
MTLSPRFLISVSFVFVLFLLIGFDQEISIIIIAACSFVFGMTIHVFIDMISNCKITKSK